jgi:hypothetical protein
VKLASQNSLQTINSVQNLREIEGGRCPASATVVERLLEINIKGNAQVTMQQLDASKIRSNSPTTG